MTRPGPGNPEVIPRIEPETRTGRGCVWITVLMTVGAPAVVPGQQQADSAGRDHYQADREGDRGRPADEHR